MRDQPHQLTWSEAMHLARGVFVPMIRPSFPWLAFPSDFDDFLGYAPWNVSRSRANGHAVSMTRQLVEYRDGKPTEPEADPPERESLPVAA